jgi:hypothetical protein
MVRWNMCFTWKRCTSTRWIHSDYPFRILFGVTFNFVWKRFEWFLSNSSHTVCRLKFLWWVASPHCSTQLLCCKFFVSVIIDNYISVSLYSGSCAYVCSMSSCSSLSPKSTGVAQRYWLTVFGGYQRWATTDSPALTATSGEQQHDDCSPASVWQWREEEEVAIVVCGKHTMVRLQLVCRHPNNWAKVASKMQLN